MASPVIEARSESATTTDATSHTVVRPTGVSGRLTLVIIGFDGAPTITWPGGYTEFFTNDVGSGIKLAGAYHQDTGAEGTSISVSTDVVEKGSFFAYQLSGAADPSTRTPEGTVNNGNATLNPNPPAITPTGGSKDYMFIAGFVQDGEEIDDDDWTTAVPTNYGNLIMTTSGTGGLATTNCSSAAVDRALTTAGPEDPATFTVAQSKVYLGFTIAVHPTSAAAEALFVGMIPL